MFDQHASNLVKQTKACEKLFRDLKAYGVALKSLVSAQQTLRDTIRELYEPDWPERENLCAITHVRSLFFLFLLLLFIYFFGVLLRLVERYFSRWIRSGLSLKR